MLFRRNDMPRALHSARELGAEQSRSAQGSHARNAGGALARLQTTASAVRRSGRLFRRRLQLVVGEYEVLLVERLVAGEAGGEIGPGVGGLVGLEGLVFPLAVALAVGIFGAPARALLHDRVGQD